MPQLLRAIRPMFKADRWRICRDDIVYILSGPDKGKTGKVLEVFKDPRVPRVIVEGRNLRKKKVRTGPGEDDYFVVTMEAPMHYSQVQVADPDTGRPIRVVFKFTPDGQRVRARKVPNPTVNDIIPTPPEDSDPRAGLVGRKDTPAGVARRGSYVPSQGFPFRVRNLERIWAGLQPDEPAAPTPLPAAGGGLEAEAAVEGSSGAAGAAGASGGGSRAPLFASGAPPSTGGATRGLCTATTAAAAALGAAEREAACGAGQGPDGAGWGVGVPAVSASFAVSGLMRRRPHARAERWALGTWGSEPRRAGGLQQLQLLGGPGGRRWEWGWSGPV